MIRLKGGPIVKSGLQMRHRNADGPLVPKRSHYRALVVNTRVTDEQGEDGNGYAVECDCLLVRSGGRLMNVPVLQRQHGINNLHDLWTPRPCTRVVSDSSEVMNLDRIISARGTRQGPITRFDDLDGDMVLISFIEGRQDYPIIVGALPHKRTNRVVITGSGWSEGTGADKRGVPEKDEYYTHHYGAEVRIDANGNLLIDTVGAYSDPATEDDSAATGDVRVRVKDTQRLTIAMGNDEDVLEVFKEGAQLRIDLGEGAAEPLVLGTAFKNYLDSEVQTKVNAHFARYTSHVHPDPITGNTGPPTAPETATIAAMPDSTLSDLAKTRKT